jgi:hypothetical protein
MKYKYEYSQLIYELTCTLMQIGSQSNYADCHMALVFIAREIGGESAGVGNRRGECGYTYKSVHT